MTSLKELEQQLASEHPSLPSETYSPLEKGTLWVAFACSIAFILGFVFCQRFRLDRWS